MNNNNTALRKLQLIELHILQEFKRICDKYHIQYFLIGGTLLGAVRHHGFIPWDDDVDVGLLRSDYIKFLQVCKKELSTEYFLQTYESDSGYANIYAKIRLNNTDFPESTNAHCLQHRGIFIDIFPYDYVPKNAWLRRYHRLKLYIISRVCEIKYDYKFETLSFKGRIFQILCIILVNFIEKDHAVLSREKLLQKYNENPTGYIGNWPFSDYPIDLLNKFTQINFEGIKFYVPNDYHTFLTYAYGDYLTPPPEEQRLPHTNLTTIKFGPYEKSEFIDDKISENVIM